MRVLDRVPLHWRSLGDGENLEMAKIGICLRLTFSPILALLPETLNHTKSNGVRFGTPDQGFRRINAESTSVKSSEDFKFLSEMCELNWEPYRFHLSRR